MKKKFFFSEVISVTVPVSEISKISNKISEYLRRQNVFVVRFLVVGDGG